MLSVGSVEQMSTHPKKEISRRNQKREKKKFRKRELKRAAKASGLHRNTTAAAQVHTDMFSLVYNVPSLSYSPQDALNCACLPA